MKNNLTDDKTLLAAYNHVDSMVGKRDAILHSAPLWHGWALREAFLAGVSYRENRDSTIDEFIKNEAGDNEIYLQSLKIMFDRYKGMNESELTQHQKKAKEIYRLKINSHDTTAREENNAGACTDQYMKEV